MISVSRDHIPRLGGTNAPSCHACTFLAETSCEEGNQLLDRTTVIGSNDDLKGFFKTLLINNETIFVPRMDLKIVV